ncbi:hypothetical protein SAMN05421853_103121 [Roseivivax halotolerans]|uniref:Uncharacterized protein n=1 Tax=Roseivivax halotolerans TaxID=93684 RepID=A0A1I5X3V2_9RHOB|nr:hypothetical protein [Roseivivax halotolerans]SFQ26630.1 hypothetical protein SAMN05421853_103121 [Roseivivax halotolerans]
MKAGRTGRTVVTMIQAAVLVALTVLGAYGASDGHAAASDTTCLQDTEGRCARPSDT